MVNLKMVRSLSICEITKFWKISCHNHLKIGSSNGHVENGSYRAIITFQSYLIHTLNALKSSVFHPPPVLGLDLLVEWCSFLDDFELPFVLWLFVNMFHGLSPNFQPWRFLPFGSHGLFFRHNRSVLVESEVGFV